MKKIRVLMCGSSAKVKGGISTVVSLLLNNDWGNYISVKYINTHISSNLFLKSLLFGVALINIFFSTIFNKYDIVHAHMSYKGSFHRKYMIMKLCKRFNKKMLVHLHGSEFKDYFENASKSLKRKIIEFFDTIDGVIVLGDSWENVILNISPKANVIKINNAVDIPKLTKHQLFSENKPVIMLFLGVLIKRKGVIDLLMALNQIKRDIVPCKLVIAGTGEESTVLKEYCSDNDLDDIVEFSGWINNEKKVELLKTSDLLILPSYNEGLPMAILEGLSYGLPIVSTNVGSITEAVVDGKNGFIVEPGDIVNLSGKLKEIINDHILRRNFSLQSRLLAEERFSADVFYRRVEAAYHEIMASTKTHVNS